MNIKEYENLVRKTQLPQSNNINYLGIGLCGEAGEVGDKLKKHIRDGKLDHEGLIKELGDVLWYLTSIAHYYKYSLEDVMKINMNKLSERMKNNTIQGNGDNR